MKSAISKLFNLRYLSYVTGQFRAFLQLYLCYSYVIATLYVGYELQLRYFGEGMETNSASEKVKKRKV